MRTSDYKFAELCGEIDYWKEEAQKYKKLYQEVQGEYIQSLNQSTQDSMNTVGQLLMLTLRSEQTEDGILIRKEIE